MKAKIVIAALSIVVLLMGCEKKKTIQPSGPYVIKAASEAGILAKYKDYKITEESLLERSGFLRDLYAEEVKLKQVLVYRDAVANIDPEAETTLIEFASKEPKGKFEAALSKYGIDPSESVDVEFSPVPEGEVSSYFAKVNELEIVEGPTTFNHMALLDIRRKAHDEKLKIIDQLLTRRLVFAEARSAKMPPENYIRERILGGDIEVNPTKFEAYVARTIPAGDPIDDDLRARLEDIYKNNIRQQKLGDYAQKVFLKTPYEVYFTKPEASVVSQAQISPVLGREKAPITIEVFSDLDCEDCVEIVSKIVALRDKNAYDVKIAYRNFFPGWKRESQSLAEAAMCVEKQKSEYFWKFHESVKLAEDGGLSEDSIHRAVEISGADLTEFKTCFLKRKSKAPVAEHLAYAKNLGISASPTIIMGGKVYLGMDGLEEMTSAVSSQIQNFGWKYKIKKFFHKLMN